MVICVCNNITESDIKRDPHLMHEVGTKCGKCLKACKIAEENQWEADKSLDKLNEPCHNIIVN